MKSITNVVEERHDVYLQSLARQWKQSRSWVLRRILDLAMRGPIEPFDTHSSDTNMAGSDGT